MVMGSCPELFESRVCLSLSFVHIPAKAYGWSCASATKLSIEVGFERRHTDEVRVKNWELVSVSVSFVVLLEDGASRVSSVDCSGCVNDAVDPSNWSSSWASSCSRICKFSSEI